MPSPGSSSSFLLCFHFLLSNGSNSGRGRAAPMLQVSLPMLILARAFANNLGQKGSTLTQLFPHPSPRLPYVDNSADCQHGASRQMKREPHPKTALASSKPSTLAAAEENLGKF